MRHRIILLLFAASFNAPVSAQTKADHDLLEVTIPQLHTLYTHHRYTVTQVTQWYLARIAKYNGIYRAVQTVDATGALARAKEEDAGPRPDFAKQPLWGVPMLIKANTSIQGLITTDGWEGFQIPGHELRAPADATVVAHLRAAGAILLGHTNMPDFAASDTNRSTAFGRTGNAYDVRFSPGGSSGGTVTAITMNDAVFGTGTDTSNSIRMPSSTSSVVGVLPTRGLVSIAGIVPLDWLLDDTGPIARNVTDAAIGLTVMAGEDPLDFRTAGSAAKAQPGPYTQYLKPDALKGKRIGVPAFMFNVAPGATDPIRPETRALFLKSLDELRAAGATIVIDDSLLPADTFPKLVRAIQTRPYRRDGAEQFFNHFGPPDYRSVDAYATAVGKPLPSVFTAAPPPVNPAAPAPARAQQPPPPQAILSSDPDAEKNFFGPQRIALAAYTEAFDRLHLDALVYPAANMPPVDETMPQDGRLSSGPHSNTGWTNPIGVPAVSMPGGFYASGLPFGIEFSARPWHDGDLLGIAFAYEQSTHHRRPPTLVESGLLPNAR
jgi:amidase